MPDVSIAVSLIDKFSPGARDMTASNSAFNKSLEETERKAEKYSKRMETLQKDAAHLKTKLAENSRELKEAEKAFKSLGDEASKERLQKAIEEQQVLQGALKDTQAAMSRTRSALFQYKSDAEQTLGKSLKDSGLFNQVGTAFSQMFSTGLESAIGQPTATAVNSILSGIVSGAATGTMAGGFGVGTAIGAAAGAGAGVFNAATTVFTAREDVFKDYYTSLYDATREAVSAGIEEGSSIAGSREQTFLAFSKRFGSSEEATAFLDRVKEFAVDTNYSYDEILGYAKNLLNTYDTEEMFDVLTTLSDASAGLDLSSSDVSMFIAGLSRMRTTGKTTQEYLNYFSERGVDVYDALARTLGVDKSAVAGMVTAGDISGATAAQSILDYIDTNFGGLSAELAGTYDAMAANLEDVMTNVNEAFGIGYNETRKGGIEAETEAYGGELGEAVSALNAITGSNQAFLDNLAEEYTREALSAVLLGRGTTLDWGTTGSDNLMAMHSEYAAAAAEYQATGSREAALTMERLRQNAESMATAAYESSDAFTKVREVELNSIEATRDLTAAFTAWTLAYEESQERSKGIVSTYEGSTMTFQDNSAWVTELPEVDTTYVGGVFQYTGPAGGAFQSSESSGGMTQKSGPGSFAVGLDRVPYDNFPALLHEGERVLTASQARAADRAPGGVVVNISGTFNVRSDEDIAAIAQAVAEEFRMEALAGRYATV